MRTLELPDMLRKYGVEPVLTAGWETRGNEFPTKPKGALRHWTAGATTGVTPSLRVVTFGRSDLPGPLCAVLQSREVDRPDRAYVIASGKANHAGAGNWNGLDSNYELLGLEIEWSGPNETFSEARRDVSERIMAALLDCGTGADNMVAEHREYALPAGRKIDTNLNGDVMRSRMTVLRNPAPQHEEEDPMRFRIIWYKGDPTTPGDQPDKTAAYVSHEAKDALTGKWFQTKAVHIANPADLKTLRSLGMYEIKTGLGSQSSPLDRDVWDAGGDFINGPFEN